MPSSTTQAAVIQRLVDEAVAVIRWLIDRLTGHGWLNETNVIPVCMCALVITGAALVVHDRLKGAR